MSRQRVPSLYTFGCQLYEQQHVGKYLREQRHLGVAFEEQQRLDAQSDTVSSVVQAALHRQVAMCLHFGCESDSWRLLRITFAEGYPQTKDSPLPRCIVWPEYAGAPDKPAKKLFLMLCNIQGFEYGSMHGLQIVFTGRTRADSFWGGLRDRFQIG